MDKKSKIFDFLIRIYLEWSKMNFIMKNWTSILLFYRKNFVNRFRLVITASTQGQPLLIPEALPKHLSEC